MAFDPRNVTAGFKPSRLIFPFIIFLLIVAVSSSVFVVHPNERAGVRTLGTVTTTVPLQPGVHYKWPFISSVDVAQVSLTNLHIPKFAVTTIDNQIITLDINISYSTPDSAVFHLLYEVGRRGNTDIHDNIIPIVQDRVSRTFSSQNTNYINEKREVIQQEVTNSVAQHIKELFRVEVVSLQIASIAFSDAFNASNATAVLSKNKAVAEENNLRVVEFQAKQEIIKAEGMAKQAIAKSEGISRSAELEAQGRAKATILEATADAQARELRGKGEASRLEAEAKALGGAANYVSYLNARAQMQWKGEYPANMTVLGDKTPVLLGLPPIPAQPKPEK